MSRSRDVLKTVICINCFILIATGNISIAVGIGYLASEGSGVIYFKENKHFNERPIGVIGLILKIFVNLMMLCGGFQLFAMSFLTIWKRCKMCNDFRRTRALEHEQRTEEATEFPNQALANDRRLIGLEGHFGPIYESYPPYTVSLV